MLFQLIVIIGIFLFGIFLLGFIFYKIADYYARRYLAFNSIDHIPIYTPSSSSSVSPTLVCVLGWGGCTRRQLRRLLDFYSSHDIPTISWIHPMFNYLFGIDQKQIEHLLDFLLHENRTSNNIIIHLHSNNGSIVWGYMFNIMKTNERYNQLLLNIKGVILDSAPYIRFNSSPYSLIESTIGTSGACVSIILNQAKYFHWFWSPLMIYYLFIRFFYRRYFSSDPTFPSVKVRELLNATSTDIKQCYLYSNGDRLVPPQFIEKFMATQVNRGVEVMSHRFIGSGHVNHFRSYPKEYGKIILDFILNTQNDKLSNNL